MYYELIRENDHLFHIRSQEGSNMELVIGEKKALLWDTSYGLADLKEAVHSVTELPLIVVNSHGHLDHINGNYWFQEAQVYIHPLDLALAKAHSSRERREEVICDSKNKQDFVKGGTYNILPEGFDEEAYINKKMPEFQMLEEGMKFDLGGISPKILHLPGHTKGSVGLYLEEDEILLAGDAFGPFTWLFSEEAANLSDYLDTLKKVQKLHCKKIFGGHEARAVTETDLENYIACAEHVDYEHGVPFDAPMAAGTGARVCVKEGCVPFQFEDPGYASVVISPSHLK